MDALTREERGRATEHDARFALRPLSPHPTVQMVVQQWPLEDNFEV